VSICLRQSIYWVLLLVVLLSKHCHAWSKWRERRSCWFLVVFVGEVRCTVQQSCCFGICRTFDIILKWHLDSALTRRERGACETRGHTWPITMKMGHVGAYWMRCHENCFPHNRKSCFLHFSALFGHLNIPFLKNCFSHYIRNPYTIFKTHAKNMT
jgi:hypothetical protein